MDDKQAEELLTSLWHIMSVMVDIGWGVDTLNIVLPELFNEANDNQKET